MRLVWVLAVVFLGCTRAQPAAGPAPEPECTFETPLQPGIPGSPGHLISSERNPNGDSELAALMRLMQKDLETARPRVMRGEAIAPLAPRYRKMRCSWTTSPEDRNATFDGLAVAYLARVAALDQQPKDLPAAFDAVVAGCRNCHEASCPGPIVAIDQLRISAPPDAAARP